MNENGSVSLLTLELDLAGCKSLKEKRGILQPLISRLHRQFNISISEIGFQDKWDRSLLACAVVSNDGRYNQELLAAVVNYISAHFLTVEVVGYRIESR